MKCIVSDLEAIGSNLGQVEFGVHCHSVEVRLEPQMYYNHIGKQAVIVCGC